MRFLFPLYILCEGVEFFGRAKASPPTIATQHHRALSIDLPYRARGARANAVVARIALIYLFMGSRVADGAGGAVANVIIVVLLYTCSVQTRAGACTGTFNCNFYNCIAHVHMMIRRAALARSSRMRNERLSTHLPAAQHSSSESRSAGGFFAFSCRADTQSRSILVSLRLWPKKIEGEKKAYDAL